MNQRKVEENLAQPKTSIDSYTHVARMSLFDANSAVTLSKDELLEFIKKDGDNCQMKKSDGTIIIVPPSAVGSLATTMLAYTGDATKDELTFKQGDKIYWQEQIVKGIVWATNVSNSTHGYIKVKHTFDPAVKAESVMASQSYEPVFSKSPTQQFNQLQPNLTQAKNNS